ncbi:hypothetical protein [uncultured Endozoicomonas sp.]|uniref:hypothetical protein n=1 Tax=uncultured Endozoicomonas sp. TaxID=432652 RepID=UPI0026336617|nr:hypothetical protein [uncultured Endozoicomonas sp.]
MEASIEFPKYEKYKASGVEWLGEIPSHWSVTRNLGLFDERKEVNQPEMELLAVTIKKGVIKQSEITTKKDSSNEDKSKYKVVRKGDLAYNKMRMWQGAIGESKYDGIVSPAYIILNTRNRLYSRYFHYLYRTEQFIKEANRNSYGLCDDMNSLRYEDFKTIYSPTPPAKDVSRIIDFLDHKTAEIDTAIVKKQELIQLLNEQKAILINRAVTKGVNPNVTLKDSGLAWIGEIPEHWSIIANRRILKNIEQGSSPSIKNVAYESGFSVVKLSAIKQGKFINGEGKPISVNEFEPAYEIKRGDLLMTRGNTPELVADVAYVSCEPDKGMMMPDLVYRLAYDQTKVSHSYLSYLLQASFMRQQVKVSARGSSHTMVKVSQDHIKSWLIPIPPTKQECEEINQYLDEKCNDIYNVIDAINREIEALKEFKQVTITNVTTGKIRV